MKYVSSKIVTVTVSIVIVFMCLSGTQVLNAQQALNTQQAPSVKRNLVLKQDMDIPGKEVVMALVELPPGSAEGRHTHPAEAYVFVQEGEILLENEGKPTTTLKAGEVFYIASGKVHQAINNGNTTAKLAAVFVAEKGKPLTTPAK